MQRFKELIDATKAISTPICHVFMLPKFAACPGAARRLAESIPFRSVQHYVESCSLCRRQEHGELQPPCCQDEIDMLQLHRAVSVAPPVEAEWVLRIRLDRSKMIRETSIGTDVRTVAHAIEMTVRGTATVVWGTPNQESWWIHVALSDAMDVVHADALGVADGGEKVQLAYAATRQLRAVVMAVRIGGVPGITATEIQERPRVVYGPEGGQGRANEYVVITTGTNLRALWRLPGVDVHRTYSNDVHEMTRLLGVEAGTRMLMHEMHTVLTVDGNYINYRHLNLLVRTMMMSGWICPVSRHGLARTEQPPLLRASFEETVDVVVKAGAFNDTDQCRGVTQAIILGQRPTVGTGAVHLHTPRVLPFIGIRRRHAAEPAVGAVAVHAVVARWNYHDDPRERRRLAPPRTPKQKRKSPPHTPKQMPPSSPPRTPPSSPPRTPRTPPPKPPKLPPGAAFRVRTPERMARPAAAAFSLPSPTRTPGHDGPSTRTRHQQRHRSPSG